MKAREGEKEGMHESFCSGGPERRPIVRLRAIHESEVRDTGWDGGCLEEVISPLHAPVVESVLTISTSELASGSATPNGRHLLDSDSGARELPIRIRAGSDSQDSRELSYGELRRNFRVLRASAPTVGAT